MADFDSSLPVRTQQNGDVVIFFADGTTPSQLASVDSNGAQRDVSDGPTLPGTAAAFSALIGGQYNITLPTLADTEQAAVQVDNRGRLLVSASNFPTTVDTNYGVVGANTIRTASQIGNATGAADFDYGVVGAQTLRTAAEIGNATGSADFNAGATGAQTLRTESNQGAPNSIANAWPVKITDGVDTVNVNADGSLNILGTVTVTNFPTTVDTNYGTVGANTIRTASQIGNATGAANFNAGATGAQTLRVEANQGAPNSIANAWPVKLTDGVDTVAVNTDGSINVVVSDATPGTPINDYKRAIGIAAGATDNHDYTVTAAKTLSLNQIEGSGSGKVKMEVQIETGVATGVFLTRWVQFNSTATPCMTIHIDNPIAVAAGVRVRVIMKNNDLTAQDMYSTISGYELP